MMNPILATMTQPSEDTPMNAIVMEFGPHPEPEWKVYNHKGKKARHTRDWIDVELSQGYHTTILPMDWELVKKYSWSVTFNENEQPYARGLVEGQNQRMHRLILGVCGNKSICGDHLNRNGLDNRLSNLEAKSDTENNKSKSMYRNNSTGVNGVEDDPKQNRYRVSFCKDCHKRYKSISYGPKSLLSKDAAFVKACEIRNELDRIMNNFNGKPPPSKCF